MANEDKLILAGCDARVACFHDPWGIKSYSVHWSFAATLFINSGFAGSLRIYFAL